MKTASIRLTLLNGFFSVPAAFYILNITFNTTVISIDIFMSNFELIYITPGKHAFPCLSGNKDLMFLKCFYNYFRREKIHNILSM